MQSLQYAEWSLQAWKVEALSLRWSPVLKVAPHGTAWHEGSHHSTIKITHVWMEKVLLISNIVARAFLVEREAGQLTTKKLVNVQTNVDQVIPCACRWEQWASRVKYMRHIKEEDRLFDVICYMCTLAIRTIKGTAGLTRRYYRHEVQCSPTRLDTIFMQLSQDWKELKMSKRTEKLQVSPLASW
jgi:hypothetical protein